LRKLIRTYGLRDLDWPEAKSAAGLAYTRCLKKMSPDDPRWASYLWRAMCRALIRATYVERKRGLTPTYSRQHDKQWAFEIDRQRASSGWHTNVWEPSARSKVEEKIAAAQVSEQLRRMVNNDNWLRIWLSVRVDETTLQEAGDRVGVSRERARQVLKIVDQRVADLRDRLKKERSCGT
jgi:hypothetical protein